MTAGILAFSNMLLLVAMRAAHGVKHGTGTRAGNLEPNAAEAGLCAVRNVLDVMIDRVQQHICGLHAGGPARRAQDAQSLLGCKECPPSLYRSGTSTPPRYTPRGPHRDFVRHPYRIERTQPRRHPATPPSSQAISRATVPATESVTVKHSFFPCPLLHGYWCCNDPRCLHKWPYVA
ncbi:hypothetical protein FB451DRAFT_422353 [Mycena latifolia]|nr:hypothetical protein FB451DRAFT_422353 [Mycena latifolia]